MYVLYMLYIILYERQVAKEGDPKVGIFSDDVGNLEYSTDREESKNFKLSRTYY